MTFRIGRATAELLVASAVFLLASVVYILRVGYPHLVGTHTEVTPVAVVELVEWLLMVGIPLVLAYGGLRLEREYPSRVDQCLAGRWIAAGVFAFLALGVIIVLRETLEFASPTTLTVPELIIITEYGALLGFVVGWYAVQTRKHQRATETQRDVLVFLNNALRHHVLNSLNVIDGHREQLREDVSPAGTRSLDTIHARSMHLEETIQTIGRLAGTVSELESDARVDLSTLLREEIEVLEEAYPAARIDVDIADGLVARGDTSLGPVLRYVLSAALVDQPNATPTVSISAAPTNGEIAVRIADDGPGLTDEDKQAIFAPASRGDEPAGFYLARTLVGHFGGAP